MGAKIAKKVILLLRDRRFCSERSTENLKIKMCKTDKIDPKVFSENCFQSSNISNFDAFNETNNVSAHSDELKKRLDIRSWSLKAPCPREPKAERRCFHKNPTHEAEGASEEAALLRETPSTTHGNSGWKNSRRVELDWPAIFRKPQVRGIN